MKTYELLVLEWDTQVLENRILRENSLETHPQMGGFTKGGLIGAGIGAGAGISAQVLSYLYKRRALKQKMNQQCGDNQDCREPFRAQLKQLKLDAIKSGLGKAISGAAAGGLTGAALGTAGQVHSGLQNLDAYNAEQQKRNEEINLHNQELEQHPFKGEIKDVANLVQGKEHEFHPVPNAPLVTEPFAKSDAELRRIGVFDPENKTRTNIGPIQAAQSLGTMGKAAYQAGSPEATEQMRNWFMKHQK